MNRQTPYGGYNLFEEDHDDIVQGCWKWLAAKPPLMDMLGSIPGPNPRTPLLFAHELKQVMEDTQSNAVVIKHANGWSAPFSHKTGDFPRIQLEFWCDSIRDPLGQAIEKNETRRRLQKIYKEFDKYLHRPDTMDYPYSGQELYPLVEGKIQWWGEIRTIDCTRQGEIALFEVPEADGLFMGSVHYGIQLG